MKKSKFSVFSAVLLAIIMCFGMSACNLFGIKLNPSSSNTLDNVFEKYANISKWNFAVNYEELENGETVYEEYYEYHGYNVLNNYVSSGYAYTDYLCYVASSDTYYFYNDNGDSTYEKFEEGTDDFDKCFANLCLVYPSELKNYSFEEKNGYYSAVKPKDAGNAVIVEYEDYYWTELNVYISGGKLSKIVGVLNDGYTVKFTFSKQGAVSFTPPIQDTPDTPTPPAPGNVMEQQTYNPSTFDHDNIQDKMLDVDKAIGLPSTGSYSALVIPVQFAGDKITQTQLNNLNVAFNGTSEQTGWESVSSYYNKASYGNLNLSFDIQPVYEAKNNSSYYERYKKTYTENGTSYTKTGEEVILEEALSYYENRLDLTKYDTNGDGCIDAVYLIYSAPVDYDDAGFYWAYVTWCFESTKYDGLEAYYYLFAGFDFMEEDLEYMPGMKVNAATYIHETGHLLGLDDYYDYDKKKGSNEGLGGADMMDYTVGDQNVYSKIMLGWLEPTIVTTTKTLTIQSSQASPSAILIPLAFDNSYFCEYLLIDLYSAQGLNALHASMKDSILYDGADYGVRIYHVSSSINDPYGSDFGSFTDNDNSMSKYALIKLVEADGERKFASTKGYASSSDLWQKGGKLSKKFPSYTRNDGKRVNFDIEIVSVSDSSATVTITYN